MEEKLDVLHWESILPRLQSSDAYVKINKDVETWGRLTYTLITGHSKKTSIIWTVTD